MDTINRSEHLNTGALGEKIAEEYLQSLGYTILEKNWSFGHKEIDLVAIDSDELVIAEVKTRREPVIEGPELSVNKKKQQNLIRAANAYVRYNRISLDVRFDILWIRIDISGRATVEHIKDAFIPCL